ncbi:amidase family protein [Pseudomonas karstica]|uniref:amidase family protein n=1 Tax=Pseudomonas karstica TaxID=1055468 RepID=UPI001FEB1F18|nr:amidase family protein [Pseudomonas karstica]
MRQVTGSKTLRTTELLGALFERNVVARKIGGFFEHYDLLLSPTLPGLAPLIGTYNAGQEHLDGRGWMSHGFNQSPFTALANVVGASNPRPAERIAHRHSVHGQVRR